MNRLALIQELETRTNNNITQVTLFQELAEDVLNHRLSEDSWSVLECIEHLNLYGKFYIKVLNRALDKAKSHQSDSFKSGWLGNRFAEMMLPNEDGSMVKMNTFKSKNPIHSNLTKSTIDEFLSQQQQILAILKKSKDKNINKIRTKTTVPVLTFKLGDTLRFMIYHNVRHVLQAQGVLSTQGLTSTVS